MFLVPLFWVRRKLNKRKWCHKLTKFLYKMMIFAIYIRLILQSYIMILFSWVSQIVDLYHSNLMEKISLLWSIIILILLMMVLFIILCQIWRLRRNQFLRRSKCDEFFNGLKENTRSRFYSVILLLQRIFSCILLMVFTE